ncbi:Origin recognition complex subunit [Nesidiocoris tenuis]|uniref:Origin recognition complex subunit 3 n=1 Tax=Nesidiocoris tenuis TaxID=355587 RepID=A0ABN7B5X7_9HEMI|nr:Origin recognition complex subunit [Nesidiocoris tenuis]
MDATASVSKGCFAFPASAKPAKQSPLNFSKEPWYGGYEKVWQNIVQQLDTVEDDVIENLLKDLANFISLPSSTESTIPAAAILTGINLPDHGSLFGRLKARLNLEGLTYGVALLNSADCSSIKHTVEKCVAQLMESNIESDDDMEVDEEDERSSDLKKSQCTLPNLLEWHKNLKNCSPSPSKRKKRSTASPEKKLVVVLKDFETFNAEVMSLFIQILSGYQSQLPFVFVLGIATTLSAIEQLLPHSCLTRLSLKAFQAQPSVFFLNNTLNKVFLTPRCPFQLSGKLFKFFTNVFLFYDFSVNRFVQGVKYCIMEHYRTGRRPVGLLCCPENRLEANAKLLEHEDLEALRRVNTFKKYIDSTEDEKIRDKLLKDDSFTKKEVLKLMLALRLRINEFYAALSLLHQLVSTLPRAPLGKQLRELYVLAMSKNVWTTEEYKECRQLLGFLSKDELMEHVRKMLDILEAQSNPDCMKNVKTELKKFLARLEEAGTARVTASPSKSPSKNLSVKNRAQLQQKLMELANKTSSRSPYELARDALLNYVMGEMLPEKLRPFTNAPLAEVVTLSETEARHRVVPRIRAPIHTALNNPAHYLMCDCCKISENGEILPSMPDLCIVYKLHLESGALINMYDWLQSFNLLVTGKEADDDSISPEVQARFTQAVSEMEFLGFVKSSKKKADHVARLTWGGSTC